MLNLPVLDTKILTKLQHSLFYVSNRLIQRTGLDWLVTIGCIHEARKAAKENHKTALLHLAQQGDRRVISFLKRSSATSATDEQNKQFKMLSITTRSNILQMIILPLHL